MINWSNWVNLGRNYTFRMAKKDRIGNRKTREQRTQFNVPELGKPFSASLLNNISREDVEKSLHNDGKTLVQRMVDVIEEKI